MATQIFIVEDYVAVRNAYVTLLEHEPDLTVCGAVSSAEEALAQIPMQQPNLVLVDMRLPGMNGLTFIAHLYQIQPTLPVVIVSSLEPGLDEPIYNVKGYVHKQDAPQRLVPTIRQVLAPSHQ